MKTQINLLPSEFRPKTYFLVLAKTLNKVAIVLVLIILVSTSLFLATYLFFLQKQEEARKENAQLLEQLNALKNTEQKFFLIKDRISKIDKVLALASVKETPQQVADISSMLSEGMSLERAVFDHEKIEASITADSLSKISDFLKRLLSSDFKKVEIESFSFSEDKGYSLDMKFFR